MTATTTKSRKAKPRTLQNAITEDLRKAYPELGESDIKPAIMGPSMTANTPAYTEGPATVHVCPHCGSEYTHHNGVEVFRRDGEDMDGDHLSMDSAGVIRKDEDMSNNPTNRRDGVRIHLWCEQCDFIHDLVVWQHKGQTLIKVTNIRGVL